MVIYAVKWDIRPEKAEAYSEWAQSAVSRLLAVPGVVEFRAYRPVTGCHQVVVTYEFTDMQAWASWRDNEATQKVFDEGSECMTNMSLELWGPSPIIPEPIRLGQ
jgi:heme-degrading monooxygenase HmoA